MTPPRRVVIAGGSGQLGRPLAEALKDAFDVRVLTTSAGGPAWQCDLTSIAETEVALAGAHTVVFLARAAKASARLTQGSAADLELLMADSVARALPRVGAEHLVFFACGEDDSREAILRSSGVTLSVLRGGGTDPVAALVELINSPQDRVLPLWSSPAPSAIKAARSSRSWSVQRFNLSPGATAEALARAYFDWLPSSVPLVRVEHIERTWRIVALGIPWLVMQHSPGRSEPDCYVLDVVDGALVEKPSSRARFEFRVLRDGSMMVALIDFAPSLPWPVYRATQALAHARVMRQFTKALEAKTAVP